MTLPVTINDDGGTMFILVLTFEAPLRSVRNQPFNTVFSLVVPRMRILQTFVEFRYEELNE